MQFLNFTVLTVAFTLSNSFAYAAEQNEKKRVPASEYACEGSVRKGDSTIAQTTLALNDNGMLVGQINKKSNKVDFSINETFKGMRLSIVDQSEKGKVPSRMASSEISLPTTPQSEISVDIQLANGSFAWLNCKLK